MEKAGTGKKLFYELISVRFNIYHFSNAGTLWILHLLRNLHIQRTNGFQVPFFQAQHIYVQSITNKTDEVYLVLRCDSCTMEKLTDIPW